MFDDLIREIQNLKMVQPGGVRIEIDMTLDDKAISIEFAQSDPANAISKFFLLTGAKKV